jgi:hypothetical protein
MSKKMAANKKLESELRVKKSIKGFIEGSFVTVLMSLVTLYALIGVSKFSISLTLYRMIFVFGQLPKKQTRHSSL